MMTMARVAVTRMELVRNVNYDDDDDCYGYDDEYDGDGGGEDGDDYVYITTIKAVVRVVMTASKRIMRTKNTCVSGWKPA